MIDKYETVIKTQKEINDILQEQIDADNIIINTQKQQILKLKECIAVLEKEQEKLIDAGNKLAQANANLEEICSEQQTALEDLFDMIKRFGQ